MAHRWAVFVIALELVVIVGLVALVVLKMPDVLGLIVLLVNVFWAVLFGKSSWIRMHSAIAVRPSGVEVVNYPDRRFVSWSDISSFKFYRGTIDELRREGAVLVSETGDELPINAIKLMNSGSSERFDNPQSLVDELNDLLQSVRQTGRLPERLKGGIVSR